MLKHCLGEFIGTFILVFFGCGSVATAILFESFSSLFEIALFWGIGIAIGIYAARMFSYAHLNPAVTIGMFIVNKIEKKFVLIYFLGQFTGAFIAAAILYYIFSDSILAYEMLHGITRGNPDSIQTAMMFGEFYPNPGFADIIQIDTVKAIVLEGFGTFMMLLVIFKLTHKKVIIDNLTPLMIGLTVTLLITIIAPFTQAGFNPARDFGPRVFAWLAGWNEAAFPASEGSFFTVYILGPVAGAVLAALVWKLVDKRSNVTIAHAE